MSRAFDIVPWIEVGNGVLASTIFLLAYCGADASLLASASLAVAAYAGYRLAFGTDPTASDLYASIQGFDPVDAARTMETARSALSRARTAMVSIRGSTQEATLEEVVTSAGRVLAQVEAQPQLLPAAQRFLDIYLAGVVSAAEKYAHLRGRGESAAIRSQFQDLLRDAKGVCERQERLLVENDEDDLSIDITVLQRRMALAKPAPCSEAQNAT